MRDAIFVDEIGVEYAIYEKFRLRSAYQPIFAPRGELLRMVAVEAIVEAHHEGKSVHPATFLEMIGQDQRSYITALCQALHMRNFCNLALDDVRLFFDFACDPAADDGAISQLRQIAGRLEELGLHPKMLMCQINAAPGVDARFLDGILGEMRATGLGVALNGFGVAQGGEALLDLVRPDIVRIDGPLFALLCTSTRAGSLLARLIAALHAHGVQVLVESIVSPHQLQVALEAGADFLQGVLLAKPLATGAFFDHGPLVAASLLPRAGLQETNKKRRT
ncbi:EAL domain-containing protein [Aquamicrobium segne]|uniref:EAL domain-containing protein n=1 Tax=Aquamicrobium segne TaxID=469547 RepID=A0ABW0H1Z5_9HYPH